MLDEFFQFKYTLTSETGDLESNRYINKYFVEIYTLPDDPDAAVLVGKAHFSIALISSASDDGFDFFELFDNNDSLLELGETIFDFSTNDFHDTVSEYFRDSIGEDILLLKAIEILPDFRGRGLGKQLIKDIYIRFRHSCSMVALKAFPMQCEGCENGADYEYENDWQRKMGYGNMNRDLEKNSYKLYAYYQKLGFQNFLRDEYFFLRPGLKNDKMDAVKF